jgi:hypothetical protein
MASLAGLNIFQAMVWMYINATMKRYAILRPGGDGISSDARGPLFWPHK